jgi:hypothetical protein
MRVILAGASIGKQQSHISSADAIARNCSDSGALAESSRAHGSQPENTGQKNLDSLRPHLKFKAGLIEHEHTFKDFIILISYWKFL